MFKYKYVMNVVNPEKNIVTLSPTAGTWAKALAPSLLVFGGLGLLGAAASYKEKKDAQRLVETINLANEK